MYAERCISAWHEVAQRMDQRESSGAMICMRRWLVQETTVRRDVRTRGNLTVRRAYALSAVQREHLYQIIGVISS